MLSHEGPLRPEDEGPDVSDLNTQATHELLNQTEEMARKIVGLVHEAVVIYLEADRKLEEQINETPLAEGAVADFYITEDYLGTPQADGNFQRCLKAKLQAQDVGGMITRGNDELVVRLPISDDVTVQEGEVPRPANVYIEHTNVHGDNTSYAVGESGFNAFIAMSDSGEEVTEFDIFQDRIEDSRVDTGLPTMAALLQNLINMKLVHQRRIIGGDPQTYNL